MFPICFLLDGTEVEKVRVAPDLGVPRMNDFITVYLSDKVQRYRVQAVEWEYGERSIYPRVTIHLRRLRPGEWGNLGEPTGYEVS